MKRIGSSWSLDSELVPSGVARGDHSGIGLAYGNNDMMDLIVGASGADNGGNATVWFLGDCPSCSGDTNGDGNVDVVDLVAVILAWGPCSGCLEDLDGSGVVDVTDLVCVILNWGS